MSAQQLIDSSGKFAPFPASPPPSYKTVAVIGCQSGGKSTLLNKLFGTDFPVLDTTRGRRRTTLGIWAAQVGSHVVLDAEGSDSRERGEGARRFESSTGLFVLLMADVVMVNMWAHDIGRYSAANYELFEGLFGHLMKLGGRCVRVIIVVRDFEGGDVKAVQKVLRGDLQNMWDAMKSGLNMSDLLDISVFPLPHMKYSAAQFEEGVEKLRAELDQVSGKMTVPGSEFEELAKTVWKQIRNNTGSLDLPKAASLAAHFSIGKNIEQVMRTVEEKLYGLREEMEMTFAPLKEFSERLDIIVKAALSEFEKASGGYSKKTDDVVKTRRREMGTMMWAIVSDLQQRYLGIVKEFCMGKFEDQFRPMLGGTAGYARNARRLANSVIAQYRQHVGNSNIPHVLMQYQTAAELSETIENIDPLDAEYGLVDEDPRDEFTVETFRKEVLRMVDERQRMGELMLPRALPPAKEAPWWKGLLMRGLILGINYLQATQAHRAALKLQRRHEKDFPPAPSF